jgi:hypothetical protein
LTISGYYGEVFDENEIDYRGARRLPAVTSIYDYNDLPAYYWKATKHFPDQRQTTSIGINIITNNGPIDTTQIVKNNWDYKLGRIHSFITQGELDRNDKFITVASQQALPDLVGSLVWKTSTVSSIALLPPPPVVSYLLVAGGGSGGPSQVDQGGGGGGGAGGLLSGTTTITPGVIYEFTIGQGGAAAQPTSANAGNDGGNSTAFGLTAIGGGGGGNGNNGANSSGRSGGSGGGGGYRADTVANGGAGTAGQGFAGSGVNVISTGGGGGGGAGGAGSQNAAQGGLGGPGVTWLDGNVYAAGGQAAPVATSTLLYCFEAAENTDVSWQLEPGYTITSVQFASYGTPGGGCGAYTVGACHASNSQSVIESLILGTSGFYNIYVDNGLFGDPCPGTAKQLFLQFIATAPAVVDQSDAPANTGNGGSGSLTFYPTYAGASGVGLIRYSSAYADAAYITGDYVYSNTGGFKTYKFRGAGSIAFISTVNTAFSGTKIFSTLGNQEWTPPPGVTSVTVTFPTTSGLVTTSISCTPLVPISVSIGNTGNTSTFGSITMPIYDKIVFNHSSGNIDANLTQTFTVATTAVTSAATTNTTNGPSATNLNVNGIYFNTSIENAQGDFSESVQIDTVPISTLVGTFTTIGEITSSRGQSGVTMNQQPTAANSWRAQFNVTEGGSSNFPVNFRIRVQQQGYFSIIYPSPSPSPQSSITVTSISVSYTAGLYKTTYSGYYADDPSFFATATPTPAGANPSTSVQTTVIEEPAGEDGESFSVQWIGYFLATTTETHTFFTSSDDASHLWIGPTAITGFTTANALVNNGGVHATTEVSGTINLVAGTYYPIRIQFGENGGGDECFVNYSTPTITKTTTFTNKIFYNSATNGH